MDNHYCSGKLLIKTSKVNPDIVVPERVYLCPICETVWSCAEITLKCEEKLAIRRDGQLLEVISSKEFKRIQLRKPSEAEPLS